jgi:hypothetical protein
MKGSMKGRFASLFVIVVAASAITVSAASAAKPYGVWRIHHGQTLQLTNMDISACDVDYAYIYVDGSEHALLGTNSGNTCRDVSLSDYTFTNTDGKSHTVTTEIYDSTRSCGYFSDGPNAVATSTAFSISDGGGSCVQVTPTLGSGNFNGDVSVFRTP